MFGRYFRQEEAHRAILAAGGRFDSKQIVCAPGIKTLGAIDFLIKRLGDTWQRAVHRLSRKPCGQHGDRKNTPQGDKPLLARTGSSALNNLCAHSM